MTLSNSFKDIYFTNLLKSITIISMLLNLLECHLNEHQFNKYICLVNQYSSIYELYVVLNNK